MKRVPGVGDVVIFGERKYAMRLWLDPGRMAQRGLSATNVLSALQEQNVQVAAGQVGQQPIPEGQTFQISVRAIGRLTEPSEFENIILKTGANGTLVRLKDVGARGAGRGRLRLAPDLQWARSGGPGDDPTPGRKRAGCGSARQG